MGDFFQDLAKSASDGFNKISRSAGRELERIGDEMIENIEKDADQISRGIEKGGFLGGFMETADVFSPGHQAVNLLDATNVIPEDPALQEGLSAGINFGVGMAVAGATGVPLFSLAGGLLALKDGADAIGAMQASPAAVPGAPKKGHTPMSPADAKRAAIEAAKAEAKERAREKIAEASKRSGYGTGSSVFDGISSNLGEIIRDFGKILGPGEPTGDDKIDEEERKMLAEIKRILNTPGMMFEDLIYALMRAVIRGTDRQAKALASTLESDADVTKKDKKALRNEVAKATTELGAAQKSGDATKIAAAQNKLAEANGNLEDFAVERADSRNERFEQLKQMLQKLSEMQQALSNILNAQHESAMAAIRNIR